MHAQNILPVMTASGQGLFRSRDFVTSGQKGPTRADMAPVAHAQNILPVPVTDDTSGHITSGSSTASLHHKYDLSCPHILLMPYNSHSIFQ